MSADSAATPGNLAATADQLDEPTGIETALARNRAFADAAGHEGPGMFPSLRLLVVACLDSRVDPAHVLGLDLGDAMVLRNGGGRITPEAINNIAFVGELAAKAVPDGPLFEVAVIHHTDCGSGLLADDDFRHRFAQRIGADDATLRDRAVVDAATTVATDVERLRSAGALSPRISVSGHVYDVATGLVETVVSGGAGAATSRAA